MRQIKKDIGVASTNLSYVNVSDSESFSNVIVLLDESRAVTAVDKCNCIFFSK